MDKTNTESNKSNQPAFNLSQHYNASQLRFDTWTHIKQDIKQLNELLKKNGLDTGLKQRIDDYFTILGPIEHYFAFPGKHVLNKLYTQFKRNEYPMLDKAITNVARMLTTESYRERIRPLNHEVLAYEKGGLSVPTTWGKKRRNERHYFEVLVVDNLSEADERALRTSMIETGAQDPSFVYDVVIVSSFEDALFAILFNYNIQSCLIKYTFPLKSRNSLEFLQHYLPDLENRELARASDEELAPALGAALKRLRPELDLYLVTDSKAESIAGHVYRNFRRVFYRREDYLELHLSIIKGITERYETPFFFALREYSQRPTSVFHAMPISRGNSVFKSHWIQDMGHFYGKNIFLAETSATTGGLDSLLQPTGPLKKAQQMAARTFGAQQTFFVTNGTSTSNKIVVQSLIQPGDIVLVDRDCHKSHHYGLVLSGANPVYLESYPIQQYSMYGAVPLKEIKRTLLELKRAGRLQKVKMLLLTNCTFDGLVYNVERVMEEVLAIKPDMIFLWDEAWFGFAYFTATYRHRTAMCNASRLYERFRSEAYAVRYAAYKKKVKALDLENEQTYLDTHLLPDPDKVKIRVYATQSTHKKLSAMRQGGMIHIWDEEFKRRVEDTFHEAYMTHTSTSANYQLLASLDLARRQAAFEGYELVQKSVELSMVLRSNVRKHPLLNKYFEVLSIKHLIPSEYRPSGVEQYYDPANGWNRSEDAWRRDEIVLDPTHVTLYIGKTGIDGDTFKNKYLMDQFGVQVNKTTRNTVLFMINIGTNRSSIAYLISVLLNIARQLEEQLHAFKPLEMEYHRQRIHSLTEELPPLPDFSCFHSTFSPDPKSSEGDIRRAFFLAYNEELCEFMKMDGTIQQAMQSGRSVVSASFVIPYPPGFPILVPGQVISEEILDFMKALDVKEIHGYNPELGLRVFTEAALKGTGSDGVSKKAVPAKKKKAVKPNQPA